MRAIEMDWRCRKCSSRHLPGHGWSKRRQRWKRRCALCRTIGNGGSALYVHDKMKVPACGVSQVTAIPVDGDDMHAIGQHVATLDFEEAPADFQGRIQS